MTTHPAVMPEAPATSPPEGEDNRPTLLTRAAMAAATAPLAAAVGAATVANSAAASVARAAALGAQMLGVGPDQAPTPEGKDEEKLEAERSDKA